MLMLRPKTGPTLCASLRSQNALGHVTRAAFDGNLREKCRGPEPRRRLCASLRSRNTHPHVTRAIYTEIYGKNAAAQNRGADFVRACAVETHIHMSQEPFIRKFTGKMPRPRTAAQTLCEPAQSKHTSTCHKSHLYGNLREKCRGPEPRRRLCASLRSRNTHPHVTRAIYTEIYGKNATAQNRGADFVRACAVETHIHMSQEPFIRKFTGKMPRPRTAAQTLCEPAQSKHTSTCHKSHLYGNLREKCRGPEPRRRLCASLRSRNTHPHVTRAILYDTKLTGKMLRPRTVSQEPLYTEIHRKRAAAQNRGPHFVRACTVKTHINMSQNHFIPF